MIDALVLVGLAKSKADARRTLEQGGAYVNNRVVTDLNAKLSRVATVERQPYRCCAAIRGFVLRRSTKHATSPLGIVRANANNVSVRWIAS